MAISIRVDDAKLYGKHIDFEDFHSNVNEEDALKDLDQLNK